MGKISPVSGKYIIHASIFIDGVVDRPDVIGAVFGQTEGLLGSDLELRELQRSGRIGRIEVLTDAKGGKTSGTITIPSSLDKAETAIIGAALEVIERIGPCNADIKVKNIEDIRISKRTQVVTRAKELLRSMMDSQMPDSTEIAEEVAESVRVMEITAYGKDKLPAGPAIDESEEIYVVEGRADVLNLLKHGFKNAIAMNGSNAPQTILDLCKEKTVTVFIDGDRGGDLNVKELASRTEIDFVCRAPDGKEVEELAKKEIHKSMRSRVALEQALADITAREKSSSNTYRTKADTRDNRQRTRPEPRNNREESSSSERRDNNRQDNRTEDRRRDPSITDDDRKRVAKYLETLIGTHGAFVLNAKFDVLGKVPRTELESTLSSMDKGAIFAIVVDGSIDQNLINVAKSSSVKLLAGMDTDAKRKMGIDVLTAEQLA
jgi:DNA primase